MLFASLAVATVLTPGSCAYAEEPTIASVATATAVEAPPGTLPVFAQVGLPEADALPAWAR